MRREYNTMSARDASRPARGRLRFGHHPLLPMNAPTSSATTSASAAADDGTERRLPFENAPNFRDFGGYLTEDGRRVRRQRLFRSGQLSRLNARDLALFARLNIRVVCDFRRPDELRRQPSQLPDGLEPVSLPISPGSLVAGLERGRRHDAETVSPEDMAEVMRAVNGELALRQTEVYQRMFELLLALEDGGMLIHCAAGKDRTGFGAALILSALGVPRETVMADYMLTARYVSMQREVRFVQRKYQDDFPAHMPMESVVPMLEARQEYLAAAFAAIDSEHASMDDYLTERLGMDVARRERLRERLLSTA